LSGREKILVLDDDRRWLDAVSDILTPHYDLALTTSHQEAIRKVASQHYALVVLDFKLPEGVSGIDVLVKMRKRVPNLRAIILTGYPESSDAVAVMKAGALDYIEKGSDLGKTLIEAINAHKRTDLVKVFLSYDRRDYKAVANLHRRLTVQGFVPWVDRNDILGGKWEPQIKKAIKQADFFIPCLSRDSGRSRGFIRRELSMALERQEELGADTPYIVPVRLSECEIPKALKEFQTVSLFKDHGLNRLVKILMSKQ
jgi:ActR/RegA family two-component response regulator